MGATTPPTAGNGKIVPVLRYGVKIVSMGFFVPKGEATIWRGPMLAKVVEKFLGGVEWGELDYLLVDLPPGTGDVQLSLCQMIPLTGAAVVSTPQDLAFNVAEKAIFMFNKLRTPVLGLVENMSGFECRHCGHREEIFGSGGARRFAMANEIPFLGEIPLSTDIRTTSDEGNPIVQSMPESPSARAFFRVAENLAAQVSTLTLGGVSTDRPEIAEITQPSESEVRILWKDGHESIYTGYALRVGCRCALCVDEMSGNKRLREESISKDVRPLSIDPVGRYAIRFQWSDGHSTGIYTFELLRELCPCPICAEKSRSTNTIEALGNRRYILRLATEARSGPCERRLCVPTVWHSARCGDAASGGFACLPRTLPLRVLELELVTPLRSGEDPVGELGRAAGAHEVDRPMEVDVDPAREFLRRLLVVPCPPKRGPAPSDHLALLAVKLSLCDRHRAPTSSANRPRDLGAVLARVARLSRADVAGLARRSSRPVPVLLHPR